mgnify:CR=1 FL=1
MAVRHFGLKYCIASPAHVQVLVPHPFRHCAAYLSRRTRFRLVSLASSLVPRRLRRSEVQRVPQQEANAMRLAGASFLT